MTTTASFGAIRLAPTLLLVPLMLLLVGCSEAAKVPEEATVGPNPTLPAPKRERIPTISVAAAKGWPAGAKPAAPDGLSVNSFAMHSLSQPFPSSAMGKPSENSITT